MANSPSDEYRHVHIGPQARFWEAFYTRCRGMLMDDIRNRYSCPVPGHIGDKQPSIGKFERWCKRPQRAQWLYWKFHPKAGR